MRKKFKLVLEELKQVLKEQRKIINKYERDENVDQDDCFEIVNWIDHLNEVVEEKSEKY